MCNYTFVYSQDVVTRLRAEQPRGRRSTSGRGKILFLSTTSRLQYNGYPDLKPATHLHLVSTLSMAELYLNSPIRLNGVVPNYLSPGITLAFSYHTFVYYVLKLAVVINV
jgi:hypothetical protein